MKDKEEESFGVIPLQRTLKGLLRILMIQHCSGYWGFPKGHAEMGESPKETAFRELQEETGLIVRSWCDTHSFSEEYTFQRGVYRVHKKAYYFPAYVEGSLTIQEDELRNAEWLFPQELVERASFPEMKRLCSAVVAIYGS